MMIHHSKMSISTIPGQESVLFLKQLMRFVNNNSTSRITLLLILLLAGSVTAGPVGRVDMNTLQTPLYTVADGAFVRTNGEHFGNRPLYCNQIPAMVLAGDRPVVRFGKENVMEGTFLLALNRHGHAQWLHDCTDITAKYFPGRMKWLVRDETFGQTSVQLDAVPLANGVGFALRAKLEKAQPGDELIWAHGGVNAASRVLWRFDAMSCGEEILHTSFDPETCHSNQVKAGSEKWSIELQTKKSTTVVRGFCSEAGEIFPADASAWKNPTTLAVSVADKLPLACGRILLKSNSEIYWLVADASVPPQSPAQAFAAGQKRVDDIARRVVVNTPDAQLDLMVAASCNVMDAVYRDGFYTHSGMRWGAPLLGWRTQVGGTVYGWHDRVLTEAKAGIAAQITSSDKLVPKPDEKYGLASQSLDSRLFGKGRVDLHQPWHYDMQSQFFDQLVHAWRWTGDVELEKTLRPALDLHLEYIRDCFDPDGDGIYESYANTWPTDDQWYDGGGTAEETAYAFNSEKAALEMAQRADDEKGIQFHQVQLGKIRQGFCNLLWVPRNGHVGAYREQTGYKRLHESSWLYSTFCPIDAGLLTPEQSVQTLYYTEWGLERIKMPYGGEQCWPSCWVPSIWSVREMWPGDNYQLALAYFQTGLAEDGWSLLRGTFPQEAFFRAVPGNLGHPAGGTDFNDCASMFCRTVVEGLFGYVPNYPAGVVNIAPQFPQDWNHAAIQTPDFEFYFTKEQNAIRYRIALTKASPLNIFLPVNTAKIISITVNRQPVKWTLTAGFGQSIVNLAVPETKSAEVEILTEKFLPATAAIEIAGNSGDAITLAALPRNIFEFHDPQNVLADAKILDGKISGILTTNAGHHIVFGLIKNGEAPFWQLFKLTITNQQADTACAAKLVQNLPPVAHWGCLDIFNSFNADVRTIFQQKYLSPRPNTCSLRLAVDGYSTWQMMLDPKNKPPKIDFSNVPKLMKHPGIITSAQGVPFHWSNTATNIAFTSQWDNWPHQVTVPIKKSGEAIWFLICGTSNPMQVQIANAELRLNYSDGVVDKLELVPPFNFWTLCPLNGFDYNYQRDAFCLPQNPPATMQLGSNCRAVILNQRLRPKVALESITLETLSPEVVVGLMGVTIMNPQ